MRNLYKNQKALLSAVIVAATISLNGQDLYAQVKVGDNPGVINAGSALEIEANDKGVLLPRVSLFKTDVWGLGGTPVAGMLIYNTNGDMFGTDAYPVLQPQGSGVYSWDGNGWVGAKFTPESVGDFDWLKSGDDTNPSAPGDITKTIYHNGSVGIGTTSPSSTLQVTGVITQASSEVVDVSANRVRIGEGGIDILDKSAGVTNGFIDFKNGSDEDFDARITYQDGIGTDGALTMKVKNSINSGYDAITILNENGFVGIDKTAPEAKLDVRGNIKAENSIDVENFEKASLNLISEQLGVLDFKKNAESSFRARISFSENGNEGILKVALDPLNGPVKPMMAFHDNGRIGVGSFEVPLYTFDVVGEINASGKVRSAGIALTSDARLKRNVQMLDNGLKIVSKLKPVSYEKKEAINNSEYNKKEIGFIAQEVQKILPQLVTEGKDADKTLALDYNSLIPVLTRAIQEQQQLIEAQSTKLQSQARKLDTQSALLDTQSALLDTQSMRLNAIEQILSKSEKSSLEASK
ncbi:tail fiber domain-containing protein [Dyadobacter sp. CY347]|uniref:tail fiber domain-containing protein n=1 Tax=Dyadobacter sp. CY347 TaxID=2909336 RepID=UPI001F3CDA4F|nr:tail fiber domain-containing protein [Dyadobacter sp. CY347]MCF2491454.1 tail fiber domain-containing protein [Dyadobacter sp. CY347]